jgi:hypothetical protein
MEPMNTTSNPNGNKNAAWIVIAIIIIIALGWWMYAKQKTASTTTPTPAPVADETVLDGIEDTTDGSVNTTTSTGGTTISYKQALITYKDKRIQLGTGDLCTATPSTVTYKNGTTIMVDNRAPVARTVKIGGTYSIKAYGFKLIKLSSATLPATWLVDCNNQQNVATILLQK